MTRDSNNNMVDDVTIIATPFTWADNLAEEALEDFDAYRHMMSYGAAQSIGMALAKLKLMEKQGISPKED